MQRKILTFLGGVFIGVAALVGVVWGVFNKSPLQTDSVKAGGGDWVNYGTSYGERQPQSGSYRVNETVSGGWYALKPVSQMEAEAQPGNVEVTINRLTNIKGTDVSAGQAGFSSEDVALYVQAGAPQGGYTHGFNRVGASVSGDTNTSSWQLNFSWTATSSGYYQIDITPRANQSRSLGWVAVRVEGQQAVACPKPDSPTGLYPNGQTLAAGSRSVTLSWNGVAGATAYWVGLKTPQGTILYQNENFSGTSVAVSGLQDGQNYDWWVQAKNSCGLGGIATASFSVGISYVPQPAPPAPSQISCLSLTANTSSVRIGDTLVLTPNVSTNQGLSRIELFYFNPAYQSPSSDYGWTQIGTVYQSGQSVYWNSWNATAGNHTLAMAIYDVAGNRVADWRNGGCATTVNFYQDQAIVPPPPARQNPICQSLTASPASGQAPSNIVLTASGYDPDGGQIRRYSFSFGDGQSLSTSSNQLTHYYANNGNFTATAQLEDDEGDMSSACSVSVVLSVPVGTPACSYNSTQARFQRSGTSSWDSFVVVNQGESVRVGGFHNGNTGSLAGDVRLDVSGPQAFSNISNNSTITASNLGDYVLNVTTPGQSGAACEGQAVLRILAPYTVVAQPTQPVVITQAVVSPQVVAAAAPTALPTTGGESLFAIPLLGSLGAGGFMLRRKFGTYRNILDVTRARTWRQVFWGRKPS